MQNTARSYNMIAKDIIEPKLTIFRIITKFSKTGLIKRKPRCGSKHFFWDKKTFLKILSSIINNTRYSKSDLARNFGKCKYFVKSFKHYYRMKTMKHKKAPKIIIAQYNRAISRSKVLFKMLLEKNVCLMMDDKTYVKKDISQFLG